MVMLELITCFSSGPIHLIRTITNTKSIENTLQKGGSNEMSILWSSND